MPWVKLTDDWYDDDAMVDVGPLGMAMWVTGLSWSARNLTNGRIPTRRARTLVDLQGIAVDGAELRADDVASQLVEAGLWEPTDGGFQIRNYLRYQPSREQVIAQREVDRRRAAMRADPGLRKALRARDGDACRYCGVTVNWQDRKGPTAGTYDHVIPVSAGGDESLGNLVVCCRQCNGRKGARTPEAAGMALTDLGRNPDPGLDPADESGGDLDIPSPVPVVGSVVNTSSSDSRGEPDEPDDGTEAAGDVPNEVWDLFAELRLKQQTKEIKNPVAWKKSTIKNARKELGFNARRWWSTYNIPARRLAECLVDGNPPKHAPLRRRAVG